MCIFLFPNKTFKNLSFMTKPFNFSTFMREEFACYSKEYATHHVSITGATKLDKSKGGVFLFLHFGSFFLSGVSLIAQLGIKYTAIASTENFKVMDREESKFWKEVHKISNRLYSEKMFLSNHTKSSEILASLKKGSFVGAALDVAEIGKKHKFHPFTFLYNDILLQTAPARLAKLAKVPLYGMTISYDQKLGVHNLELTGPYDSCDVEKSVQMILTEMEPIIQNNMDQLFHDIFHLFSFPRLKDHIITTKQKKECLSVLAPIKQLKSQLPSSFCPRFESTITSWHPHRDFAYNLVKKFRPEIIVELGVHYGDSYFTFCQACDELELNTQLYGVDHWQGDKQAGFYGDDVFREVNEYNQEFHSQNSTFLRIDFTEALKSFETSSIDLLHIDGSHEYQSVRNDFGNWLPKIKKGGMILLHDILVEREDFGVKEFWKEISKNYKTESHQEGFGLGVIHV